MESPFSKMFLALQDKINAAVPEIRFIEQNFAQYGFDDFRAKVAFPALLVDFSNTTYTALQGNIQLAETTINIVLLFEPFSQSYNLAPLAVKQKALAYFEIEQKVFKALQGFEAGGICTPMVRINAKSQNKNDIGMRIRELDFTTEFEDYSLNNDVKKEVSFSFNGSIDN